MPDGAAGAVRIRDPRRVLHPIRPDPFAANPSPLTVATPPIPSASDKQRGAVKDLSVVHRPSGGEFQLESLTTRDRRP